MKKTLLVLFGLSFLGFELYDDFNQTLRNSFQEYLSTYKPTQIEVFFNQPSYFPGDTAYFATRYSYLQTGELVNGRELIHLTMIDANDSTVLDETTRLNNGIGSNQLPIPVDIKPGIYTLYVYSHWMLNLGTQSIYKIPFLIEGDKIFQRTYPLHYVLNASELIEGVRNQVTIQCTPLSKVSLVDNSGAELATAATGTLGTTTIRFTPISGKRYSILCVSGTNTERLDISEPVAKGFSVQTLFQKEKAEIIVSRSPDWEIAEPVFLVINSASDIFQVKRLPSFPSQEEFRFTVPDGLGEVLTASLITQTGKALNRIKFIGDTVELVTPEILIPKGEYSPRSPITIQLKLHDNNLNSLDGNFSVRVIHKKLLDNAGHTTHQVFTSNQLTWQERSEIVNLQNKNSINWESVLAKKQIAYSRESSLMFKGKVFDGESNEGVPDSTKVMLYFQNRAFGQEAYAKGGEIDVPIVFDTDHRDNIFTSGKHRYRSLPNIKLKLVSKSSPPLAFDRSLNPKLGAKANEQFLYKQLKSKVETSFGYFSKNVSRTLSNGSSLQVIEDELGEPDYTLVMEDYLILPTMAEVVKELLKSVEYRNMRGNDRIRVYTTGYIPQKSGDPLFVIDGQLTKNANDFLKINPSDVVSIKVYRDKNKVFRFGQLTEDGVLVIKTRKPFALVGNNTIPFLGPVDQAGESTIGVRPIGSNQPDLRQLLYWNPNKKVDQNGLNEIMFYSADDTGEYIIQINGTTKGGTQFSTESKFTVRARVQ